MKKKIIIILLFLFILLLIGYKSYNLYIYKTDKIIALKKGKDLSISLEEVETNNKIGNLSFYLDPMMYQYDGIDKYTKYEDTTTLPLSDALDNTVTSIQSKELSKSTIKVSYINSVVKNTCRNDKYLGLEAYLNLVLNTDFNTEVNVIKYYLDNSNSNLSIISSNKKIKLKYISNLVINNIDLKGSVSFFDKLNGYISSDEDNKYAVVFNNEDMYKFSFTKDYTDDDIISIVETFKFN